MMFLKNFINIKKIFKEAARKCLLKYHHSTISWSKKAKTNKPTNLTPLKNILFLRNCSFNHDQTGVEESQYFGGKTAHIVCQKKNDDNFSKFYVKVAISFAAIII
jgi:hypothetical protein